GAWSPRLLQMPVLGGKGYSFTVRPTVMPAHALLFVETHVVCSPLSDTLAGRGRDGVQRALFSRRSASRRVDQGESAIADRVGTESSTWAGLRPVAPDGMPVVGRWPARGNLYVATGYSMF